MLERLAQTGTGRIPKNQVAVVIDIPDEFRIEHAPFDHAVPPLPLNESRGFGDRWLASGAASFSPSLRSSPATIATS